jgi:Fe-S cluster biogenesis protein NfuA
MSEQTPTVEQRIERALDTVRPFLKADGGDVELVSVDENNVVSIRLLGSCKDCEISDMTMKMGIEEGIKHEVPEIKNVVAVNQNVSARQ